MIGFPNKILPPFNERGPRKRNGICLESEPAILIEMGAIRKQGPDWSRETLV